jgi:hypothetical protein
MLKHLNSIRCAIVLLMVVVSLSVSAQTDNADNAIKVSKVSKKDERATLSWPPKLPDGKSVVTDQSAEFLLKPEHVVLDEGVEIAKTAPVIDFLYMPGQTHLSKLWSVWGDGSCTGDKYYTSIGDHNSPRGEGQVYEYDNKTKQIRLLMNVKEFLQQPGMMPEGMDYIPGKIHSRTEMGSDGWVYFSTHRGSTQDNTTDKRGYKGDNIYRVNPQTGEKQIAALYPMPKHTIPASVLDPKRLIYYGGTAPGNDATDKGVWFIAYDVKNNKLLKRAPGGFDRYAMFSKSTGCVYWKPLKEKGEDSTVEQGGRKYDPNTNTILPCPEAPVVRACSQETKQGIIYGFTQGNKNMWAFDVKHEKLKVVGPGTVASQIYITTMDLDPVTERYIYYVPGAHGGGVKDGTPIVQYDLKTNKRKIIAFLSNFYTKKYGYSPDGTFSTAVSPDGSTLFITWNGSRLPNPKEWDTVAMTAIHIPASERQP